jgi:pimeloyl-ACP methyl ester carboxylesterase
MSQNTAQAPQAAPQEACAAQVGLAIPASSIGLPTSGAVVRTASFVAGDAPNNTNGEYCAVTGMIAPVSAAAPGIEFQVNLPTQWNQRALQLGGGAYDGVLVTGLGTYTAQPAGTPNALKQGYATLGSDGGHKASSGFDGTFALNEEALYNFGQHSVKKTHDVAVAILQKRYGKAPQRFYFIGGSQGGHEALDAAARYPTDYDGVIANYPAYNVTLLQLASLHVGKALYSNQGAGWINPVKKTLLTDAVYAACDGLDGAKDGIIGDVAGCNAAFNIDTVKATLRCVGGTDTGDTCLSDAQIGAVQKIASPYDLGFEVAGQQVFPRWPLLEGALFNRSSLGASPVPSSPPAATDALQYAIGTAHAQFFATQNPKLDPLTYEPAQYKTRLQTLGNITDVTTVSLAAFRAKGGKLILTHGSIDDFISPHNTVNYYQRQVAAFGQAGVDSFVRFYAIPGYGHGFGPYNLGYDGLAVLNGWVESGKAPEVIASVDNNPNANRSRPMCRWPARPIFTGAAGASLNDAANFSCKAA